VSTSSFFKNMSRRLTIFGDGKEPYNREVREVRPLEF